LREPPGPVDIRARDGVRLALIRAGAAAGPPVLLVPGTFSNHTFWLGTRGTGFARHLAAEGYETWTLDPRGHGLSQRAGPADRWGFDDWARADVPAALERVASADRPAVVIGHSAGGAAILAALAGEPGLRPLVGAAIVLATPLPYLQRHRRVFARAVHAWARRARRFPARLLRLGPEDEPAGVIEEWFRWNLGGHWRGRDGTPYDERLRELTLPMLVVAGAGDRLWAPPPAVRAVFDRIGSTARRFVLAGRAFGFREDYGHVDLVVGRSARAEIWPLLTDWLAGAGPGRPAVGAASSE
jgi:predicted alpha/beta hydrolase